MKTTKKQFINLIKEVTDEVVGEALSAVVPRRPQENVNEAPQKNLSNSNPQKPVNNDIKKFSNEVLEKIKDRQRKKGFSDMNIGEAIRQIIEFKMTKEGWSKGQSDADTLQARRNIGDPRESIKESSTTLDNYQIESVEEKDKAILAWAKNRLSRESNPDNMWVLEKVIEMIRTQSKKSTGTTKPEKRPTTINWDRVSGYGKNIDPLKNS